jgi:hypothetical protein
LPAASIARTLKVWLPSARPLYEAGDVHAEKAPPSSLHWKVEACSEDVNEKLAAELPDGFGGCDVIVVSGATVSIVQVKLGGLGSTFPTPSVARTVKVWLLSARPL